MTVLRNHGFSIDLAYASVGRPSWWWWSENPWSELRDLIVEAATIGGSDLTNGWRAAAMHGACLLDNIGSAQKPVVLAAVAILGSPSGEEIYGALEYGKRLSRRVESADPRSKVMQAAIELSQLGLLDDPDATVSALGEFEARLDM